MKARKLLIALITVTVWGCSMRRLAIENYEWLATRAAVNFADLTSDQKDQFKTNLRSLSQTIRDKQLGSTLKALDALPEIRDPAAAAKLIAELSDGFRMAAGEACRTFAPLLSGFSPAQLDHLQRKLAERNEKYDPRHNGGLVTYRAYRQTEARSNAEDWFGPLNDAQLVALDSQPAKDSGAPDTWENDYLAYRLESQQIFVGILREHRGHAGELERDCLRFVERPDEYLSAKGQKTRALHREHRNKTGLTLLTSLEPPQRAHFRKEIDRLIRDLNAWSAHIGNL